MVFSENEVGCTMPWCPKCRAEYREGFFVCNSCSEQLVDDLPLDAEYNVSRFKYDPPEFLISLKDGREAEVVESLLTAYQIPVIKKFRDAGAYLEICTGTTVFGVDVYVPSRLLQKAKDILNSKIMLADDVDVSVKANRSSFFKTWYVRLSIWPMFLFFLYLLFVYAELFFH